MTKQSTARVNISCINRIKIDHGFLQVCSSVDSNDYFLFIIFMFKGHYRGTGPLLVEKQVIVRKGDAYPIEQSAVAKFKEGGHIEGDLDLILILCFDDMYLLLNCLSHPCEHKGHHHKTAIETFTGFKGKCIFEILSVEGKRDVIIMEPGFPLTL